MCRAVYWYDSAEYVAAAVTIGIPHPPGYPLYTLIAHTFTWLPVNPAIAVNAVSAVFGAVAVGLSFGAGRALGLQRAPALFAAALLGAGTVFWGNAVVAEVYTPGLAVFFTVVWLLARGVREDRPLLLVGASALAGAGMGVHMSIATTGLGLGLLVFATGLPIEAPARSGATVLARAASPSPAGGRRLPAGRRRRRRAGVRLAAAARVDAPEAQLRRSGDVAALRLARHRRQLQALVRRADHRWPRRPHRHHAGRAARLGRPGAGRRGCRRWACAAAR